MLLRSQQNLPIHLRAHLGESTVFCSWEIIVFLWDFILRNNSKEDERPKQILLMLCFCDSGFVVLSLFEMSNGGKFGRGTGWFGERSLTLRLLNVTWNEKRKTVQSAWRILIRLVIRLVFLLQHKRTSFVVRQRRFCVTEISQMFQLSFDPTHTNSTMPFQNLRSLLVLLQFCSDTANFSFQARSRQLQLWNLVFGRLNRAKEHEILESVCLDQQVLSCNLSGAVFFKFEVERFQSFEIVHTVPLWSRERIIYHFQCIQVGPRFLWMSEFLLNSKSLTNTSPLCNAYLPAESKIQLANSKEFYFWGSLN